jgi:hypothetical protein
VGVVVGHFVGLGVVGGLVGLVVVGRLVGLCVVGCLVLARSGCSWTSCWLLAL